ncbi:hypothetical protein FDP41_010625 [Naegleria fowleri]|uniref:ABC-2 type transporter domain-containing protein n=1 Tax=Naegleria fowleri TaxID=5763 RepID=A0A6A5CD80_NAEFO|nr:uncharacterized protein FDP41_010625 [Naegleria fowleri]KAF0983560.1 hypothetical protein FDP41_010625 [Naegleria fowleri]
MYFLAKDLVSLVVVIIISLSTSIGLVTAFPHMNFVIFYGIVFLTIMAGFPLGYTLSFFFEPAIAQLAAALVVIVFYSLAGNNPTLPEIEKLAFPLSYSHIFTYFRYIKGLVYMHELDTRRKEQSISEALKMNGYEYESLFFYYYALFFWMIAFRYMAMYCMWAWKPRSLFSKMSFHFKKWTGRMGVFLDRRVVTPVRAKMSSRRRHLLDTHVSLDPTSGTMV